jgi:pimeloyl-ACP methyl ester carboxylesterase
MRFSLGSLPVDVVRAEAARFRHPLLFVHGLWTGSWIWHGFMGYLAHRGWESWAPSFLEGGVAEADRVEQLIEVCRAMPAVPVVIGHDAGAILAATLAAKVASPAVVTIAPSLPGPESVHRLPRFWAARWFGSRVDPPSGPAAGLMIDEPDRLRPDSGRFFRALASGTLGMPTESVASGLVVCSTDDALCPSATAALLARNYGWAFEEWPTSGHAPMLRQGWEAHADRLHRWLVLTLGEDLLAWLDDENDPE